MNDHDPDLTPGVVIAIVIAALLGGYLLTLAVLYGPWGTR